MGLFDDPRLAPKPIGPKPLAQDRVISRLDAADTRYQLDDDGDIATLIGSHLFLIMIRGEKNEILQVAGRWNRVVSADEFGKVLEFANEWNAKRLWPKIAVTVTEPLAVVAEHNVDYEFGVTDEQLDQHLRTGIASALHFFEELEALYPDAPHWVASQDEES